MTPGELVEDCGRAAAGLLERLLGERLVGAYLVGSGALGGVAPGQSDVDVVAVCAAALPRELERAVVAGLAGLAMTWPLRGLELVLDLAILRDHGRPLAGPPPRDLVGPIPRRRLLEAVRDSLAWHAAHEPNLPQAVLNASRGWRFTEEGVWCSKDEAGAWAGARDDDPATVEAALAVRHGDRGRALEPARVLAFQRRVLQRVERELAGPAAGP